MCCVSDGAAGSVGGECRERLDERIGDAHGESYINTTSQKCMLQYRSPS